MSSSLRSKPLYKMAQLIAASATFQGIIAAAYGVTASAQAALAHIHILEAIDVNATHQRPRAIVNLGPDWNRQRIGTGTYRDIGSVQVCFEFPPADATAGKDANLLAFTDQVGAILEECGELAGVGDAGDGETYLNVVEWSSLNGAPDFCDQERENGVVYLVDGYTARWE